MLKQVCLAGVLISLITPGFSQSFQYTGGDGRFNFGYARPEVNKLEQFIPSADGASDLSISRNTIVTGGSGSFLFEDFLVSLEGYSLEGETNSVGDWCAQTEGGMALLNIGYNLTDQKRLRIAPKAGVGFIRFGASINRSKDVDFNEIESGNDTYGRTLNVGQQGLLLNGSIKLDYYPIFGEDKEGEYGGLLTSLEIGYWYQPSAGDWSYEAGDISNGPDFQFGGPYVQLGIGGGGFNATEQ